MNEGADGNARVVAIPFNRAPTPHLYKASGDGWERARPN